MDTYGYMYNKTFTPFFPSVNLVKSADDEGGNHQFLFGIDVQAGTMITLVVTTYSPNTVGAFSVIVAGPATVQFLQPNITGNNHLGSMVKESRSSGITGRT